MLVFIRVHSKPRKARRALAFGQSSFGITELNRDPHHALHVDSGKGVLQMSARASTYSCDDGRMHLMTLNIQARSSTAVLRAHVWSSDSSRVYTIDPYISAGINHSDGNLCVVICIELMLQHRIFTVVYLGAPRAVSDLSLEECIMVGQAIDGEPRWPLSEIGRACIVLPWFAKKPHMVMDVHLEHQLQ